MVIKRLIFVGIKERFMSWQFSEISSSSFLFLMILTEISKIVNVYEVLGKGCPLETQKSWSEGRPKS